MASLISAGTTSGTALNMSGDTSGVLQLATNGTTTAVTINTSQYVGIGTTSPASGLDIRPGITGNFNAITMGYGRSANPTDAVHKISWSSDSLNIEADTANTIASNIIFTNDNTERMRIDSNGVLLVNTTTAANAGRMKLNFAGVTQNGIVIESDTASASGSMLFKNTNGVVGNITTTSSSTAFSTSSDYRLKENITPMMGALAKVAQLKPVTYKWKIDGADGEGFIAHELAEVKPHAVIGEKDAVDADGNPKYQGIDTSFLVATLTAALQETKALIDTQAETINALTARIVALEGQ